MQSSSSLGRLSQKTEACYKAENTLLWNPLLLWLPLCCVLLGVFWFLSFYCPSTHPGCHSSQSTAQSLSQTVPWTHPGKQLYRVKSIQTLTHVLRCSSHQHQSDLWNAISSSSNIVSLHTLMPNRVWWFITFPTACKKMCSNTGNVKQNCKG